MCIDLLQSQREAVLSVLAARAYLYRILQLVAGNTPTRDALLLLVAKESKEALSAYAGKDTPALENAPAALDEIAKHLEDMEFLSRCTQEYTARFIGPGKLDASPWESVYVTKEPLLFQKNTLEVRQFYRKYSVLPKAYPRVADDHLGLELDFMALLSKKTYDALEEGRIVEAGEILEDQRCFLQDHLLKWIPEYAKRATGIPDSGLYAIIANIIKEFAEEDYKIIGELLLIIVK